MPSPIRFLAVIRAKEVGYPVEIGWADEDGIVERHAIRPAPDWGARAETDQGEPYDLVARRVLEALAGKLVVTEDLTGTSRLLRLLLRSAGIADDLPLGSAEELWQHACTPLLRLLPRAGTAGRDAAIERLTNQAAAIVTKAQARHPKPPPRHVEMMVSRPWAVWRDVVREVGVALARGAV